MIVAIHQPNYMPWLGYFAKMARSDVFIFLDDVQYSKNSYINRVQIDVGGSPRWLTVPVSYSFGDAINQVRSANDNWRRSHLDTLKTIYGGAAAFKETWPWLVDTLAGLPHTDLAASNRCLIEAIASRLGIRARLLNSSDMQAGYQTGDERLISLLRKVGPNVIYLSGKGGQKYQDPSKFEAASIALSYIDFMHPSYDQGHDGFVSGLSILDAMFRLGTQRTADLIISTKAIA